MITSAARTRACEAADAVDPVGGEGGCDARFVVREGETYAASSTSRLQKGDVIKTDANTVIALEF